MKKLFLYLALIPFFSCSRNGDSKSDNTCDRYVPGNVIAGIKSTVGAEEVFGLCNSLGLQIDQMTGFYYTSPYPKDSIPSLIAFLNTKPYITTRGFSATPSNIFAHYQTGIVKVLISFWDMTPANQQDWIKTKNALKLENEPNDRNMLLLVPAGKEKSWADKLRLYNIVTWTELNCYVQLIVN